MFSFSEAVPRKRKTTDADFVSIMARKTANREAQLAFEKEKWEFEKEERKAMLEERKALIALLQDIKK